MHCFCSDTWGNVSQQPQQPDLTVSFYNNTVFPETIYWMVRNCSAPNSRNFPNVCKESYVLPFQTDTFDIFPHSFIFPYRAQPGGIFVFIARKGWGDQICILEALPGETKTPADFAPNSPGVTCMPESQFRTSRGITHLPAMPRINPN